MTSDRWARVGGGIKSGMLLGPYRLQDVVGEGGMGVVIVALDTKLQRPVAISFSPRKSRTPSRAAGSSAKRSWPRR